MSAPDAPRVLVVRNDKLGDFLLAWPALAILRASLPAATLDVLVPEYTRSIAELCPSVDGVVLDPGPEAGATALLERLRAGRYDALLTLFSSTRVGFAGWRAGIPTRIAPATKLAQVFYNERVVQRRSRSLKPEFEYNADLARDYVRGLGAEVREVSGPYLGFDRDLVARLEAEFRARLEIPAEHVLVFLHPGSGGSANNLSLEQYATLARGLSSERGHTLIISAGPGEQAIAHDLHASLADISARVYESSAGLACFAQHLAFADLFVAGSTGTLHLAGALDCPTGAFYPRRRSSTPLRWQTLNSDGRRLAWSPPEGVGERDMSSIDVASAARELSERFLASGRS